MSASHSGPATVRGWSEDVPEGRLGHIRLNRPARCNALTRPLLDAANATLCKIAAAEPGAIIISAQGPHFSTGGDVLAFRDAVAAGLGRREAEAVVGALNAFILALMRLPIPVIVAANGAITGGAAGLVFAADMVVLGRSAFLQP